MSLGAFWQVPQSERPPAEKPSSGSDPVRGAPSNGSLISAGPPKLDDAVHLICDRSATTLIFTGIG